MKLTSNILATSVGGVQGVQAHPQNFLFGENSGKIRGNLGKISEDLHRIPENLRKNGGKQRPK